MRFKRSILALGLCFALSEFLFSSKTQASDGQAAQSQVVDLELILAVDTSSSVSQEEFDLQMRGFAEAFRHPAVIAAVRAAGSKGVAISMIQWASAPKQQLAIDWQVLTDEASVENFAAEIDNTPRYLTGGGTGISGAVEFSLRQFQRNGFKGPRQVIDISGDGRANQGEAPSILRDAAVDIGVTINGLAILNEDPFVDSYYLAQVIGGAGAFVMTATDYSDFSEAMLQKLLREIAGAPLVRLPPEAAPEQQAQADY